MSRNKDLGWAWRLPPKHIVKHNRKRPRNRRDPFYKSQEWLTLRYKAFTLYGNRCQCCHATGVQLQVDHIKPRHRYPELELDIRNVQVLCARCNYGKGAWDQTDWRGELTDEQHQHMQSIALEIR